MPEPPKSAKEPDRRNRLRRLTDQGREPALPDVEAPHLLGYLHEIGPALPGMNGPAAITQGEIRAWQENTRIVLSPWEARTIRTASRAYVSELNLATDPKRPAPYAPQEEAPQLVAMSMRAALRAMAEE